MQSARLSQRMHSSGAAAAMVAVAALMTVITAAYPGTLPLRPDAGLALPGPEAWHMAPWLRTAAGIAANLAIVALMAAINSTYNVLRDPSRLMLGMFALMQCAVPAQVLSLSSGTLTAIIVLIGIYLMLSTYAEPDGVRRVFLAFLLLALGSTMQYALVLYMAVFLAICAQMRIMAPRTLLAALMGVATVWILLVGSGAVAPDAIRLPRLSVPAIAARNPPALYLLAVVAYTALIVLGATALNVAKTIAYNARSRAYNGTFVLLSLVTAAACAADYADIAAYLPLLNVCAAYQLTHYFVNHRTERQYAAVLAIGAIYLLLYLWRIAIS